MIRFYEEGIGIPKFPRKIIKNWIKEVIEKEGKLCGELVYYFCDNIKITEINIQYLDHHYATDIITFNYNEDDRVEGEMFLGLTVINENSITYKTTQLDELFRVIIHGVLHLIGFDDQTEEDQKEMTRAENEALSLLYTKYF